MSTPSLPSATGMRLVAVLLVALTLPLGGCVDAMVAEGASTVATGKTLSDQIISFASGKDCSVVRKEQGMTYCVEDEPTVNQDSLYCYQTLGDVVCYNKPDPRAADTRVGVNDQNQVVKK